MKKILLIPLLLFGAPVHGQDCSASTALMKHVYHPDRLVERKGCITVTGTIVKKLKEGDGDFHVRLKLDPGQDADLINDKNNSIQGGNLVFEPICVNKVTQQSAKAACKGFHQIISLPNNGDHVSVTGIHMLDNEHGWLEIHPVTAITLLDTPSPNMVKPKTKHKHKPKPKH
jgi:hypothetical protein